MDYSIEPYVDAMVGSSDPPVGDRSTGAVSMFALVDGSQLKELRKARARRLSHLACDLVFEDSFAKAAVDLSPVLFQLSEDHEICRKDILAIDGLCRHLPVLAILKVRRSALDRQRLLAHLRSFLLVEADGEPYLFRYADSQMLAAAISVLTSAQRARLFGGIESWWSVDHNGALGNAAEGASQQLPESGASAGLVLDAEQTHALLTAAEVPLLAGQLRQLEHSFERSLSHAEQMRFAAACIANARETGLDDAQWTARALERWREHRPGASDREASSGEP